MTSILDKLRGIRREQQAEQDHTKAGLESQMIEIAVRDHLDDSEPADAERLDAILAELGMNVADYESLLRGIERAESAVAHVAYISDAMDGNRERTIAARREMYQLQGELKKAQKRVGDLFNIANGRNTADTNLRRVQDEYPQLFDADGNAHSALAVIIGHRKSEFAENAAKKQAAAMEKIEADMHGIMKREGVLEDS